MVSVGVKIVWFSRDNTLEAEQTLAELLSDGWQITHVSGGGSESYASSTRVGGPYDTLSAAASLRQRPTGFVILQKGPSGGGNIR